MFTSLSLLSNESLYVLKVLSPNPTCTAAHKKSSDLIEIVIDTRHVRITYFKLIYIFLCGIKYNIYMLVELNIKSD